LRDPREFNTTVPDDVAELIIKGMTKDIDGRPTLEEFSEALDVLIEAHAGIKESSIEMNINVKNDLAPSIKEAGKHLAAGEYDLVPKLLSRIPTEVREDKKYTNVIAALEGLNDANNYTSVLEGFAADITEWETERKKFLNSVDKYESGTRPPLHSNLNASFLRILNPLKDSYDPLPSINIHKRLEKAQVDVKYNPESSIMIYGSLEEANAETEKARVDEETLEDQVDEETRQSNALIKEMFHESERDKPLSKINEEYRNISLKFLELLENVSDSIRASIRKGEVDTSTRLYDTFKNRAKAYVCFQQYVIDALSECKLPNREVVNRLTETFRELGAVQYANQMSKRYSK